MLSFIYIYRHKVFSRMGSCGKMTLMIMSLFACNEKNNKISSSTRMIVTGEDAEDIKRGWLKSKNIIRRIIYPKEDRKYGVRRNS